MRRCELCGEKNPRDAESCSRCGFEFRRELQADARDGALLDRHAGKPVKVVRRELRNKRAQMRAYLDNLAAKSLSRDEISSLVNESLAFLQIPLEMGVDDTLAFDADEGEFITMMADAIERADADRGGPGASAGTYIRLSNALHFLDQQERAMRMAESALLINPKDPGALLAKAMLLFAEKKYPQARRCLEKLAAGSAHPNARYLVELIDQMSA